VVVVMAAIFVVSSLPDAPLPSNMSDKSGHVLAYAGLGLTVVRAVAGGLPRPITLRLALLSIAITTGYGATDEIHQSFVPGRTADVGDLYADGAGAVAATVACWAWGILACRRRGGSHDV
jgi:VanZ family protein